MKVSVLPNNYQPTGVCSFASWSNPDLLEAIRRVFGTSPREELVEIVIEREGIKAVFEYRASRTGDRDEDGGGKAVSGAVLRAFLAAGWTENGFPRSGRVRVRDPRSNRMATVGKRTTCFYRRGADGWPFDLEQVPTAEVERICDMIEADGKEAANAQR